MSESIELPDDDVVVVNDDNIDQQNIDDQKIADNHENDGYDDGEYGKKVQKRINKVVSERNKARADLNKAGDENNDLRTRIDLLEKRTADEDSSKKKLVDDGKIADIKRRKMEFMDEGEYEKAEDLNDELIDIKMERREQMRQNEARDKQRKTEQENPTSNIPDAQMEWMEKNNWYRAEGSLDKSAVADKEYLSLVSEGYDPNDEETYSELDSRLKRTPKRESPIPGQSPNRGEVDANDLDTKKGGRFTTSDAKRMREFKLNPDDPNQRKSWLENKNG